MLVNCPQCGRSIDAPAPSKSQTAVLTNCPSCGKFAVRPAPLPGEAKPAERSGLTWLPPLATPGSQRR